MAMAMAAAPSDDILSWTNQDARESVLFNSWGVLYRFQVRVITRDRGLDLETSRRRRLLRTAHL
jgi:hypothetical protein